MNKRIDMSDWLIHFVHSDSLKSDFDPNNKYDVNASDVRLCCPVFIDKERNPKYIEDFELDNDYKIPQSASAYEVLKRIVHDGFIRSGWSFRNGNPTIYGPYSAVCMTEMPLYALIQYANQRKKNHVDVYGIALDKASLFNAGARNVIYGLSTKIIEADPQDSYYGFGYRTLSKVCGLGLEEQFRYVTTSIGTDNKNIDWTHEREWRLPIKNDKWSVSGIPFLLERKTYKTPVDKAIIIVSNSNERENMLAFLTNLYLAGVNNSEYIYEKDNIFNTQVIAVDEVLLSSLLKNYRLDSMDSSLFHSISLKQSSENSKKHIQQLVSTAKQMITKLKKTYNFQYSFPIGHNYIITKEYSEYTQALIDLNYAFSYAQGFYKLDSLYCHGNTITGDKIMKHIADYLSQETNQKFETYEIPD